MIYISYLPAALLRSSKVDVCSMRVTNQLIKDFPMTGAPMVDGKFFVKAW